MPGFPAKGGKLFYFQSSLQKNTMKTLYTFLAAGLFFLAATATAQTIKSETIKVWGNCGMCKKTIETAAKDAGATAAVWDKNTKMLAIKYDGAQTSAQKIQEKIAAAGYDTRDFRANDEAYKNLEECCQYKRKAATPAKPAQQAMKKPCCSKDATAVACCGENDKKDTSCCVATTKDCQSCCS
jgi:mercuric ion binding protein